MTADRETARLVRSWLQEDGTDSAERILVTVLDRLDTTPQHRSWWPARRSPMNTYARLAAAAAAVVVVAVIGYNLLPGRGTGIGGTPTSSPSATLQPSAAVTASPAATPRVLGLGDLHASRGPGRLLVADPFAQKLEFTVTAPWLLARYSPGEASFNRPGDGATFIGFFLVSDVYKDPCHPAAGVTDLLSVGAPAVDGAAQLEAALLSMKGWTSTPVTERTIAGFPARGFTLSMSMDTSKCADPPWVSLFDPMNGELARTVSPASEPMWIVDLNGGTIPTSPATSQRPLLIVAEPGSQDSAAGQADLDAIIDSLTIN
jgi:hypothetical protein